MTRCAAECPGNVLQIASAPKIVDLAGKAESYALPAITAAALVVYLARLRTASKPGRRSLAAVAVTSLLYLPVYFVYSFAAWILLWRDEIASVLDDRSLRLGYHDPATETYREADGGELTPPPASSRLAWVPVERDDQPVAAMVIDETLAEDPELVRATASATLVAVENGQLEGELRASRERVVEAGLAERPHVLAERGVRAALADAARTAPMPVDIRGAWHGRHSEAVEVTVYFCCLECLQNAAKHAGRGASVMVRLSDANGRVGFCVEDDGAGFDPKSVPRGAGLTNLEGRLAALGGTLHIDAAPGRGTRITGDLPG